MSPEDISPEDISPDSIASEDIASGRHRVGWGPCLLGSDVIAWP